MHRRGAAAVGLAALAAGMLAGATPSAADVTEVTGGAFGQRVSVAVAGGPAVTSGPLPIVTAAPTGGSVRDTAPAVHVGRSDPAVPYGGAFLRTGLLTASSWGRTGPSGSLTTSATAGAVDALASTLTARRIASACVSAEQGSTGTVTLTGGRLAMPGAEAVDLPDDPAPGTTYTGEGAGAGERLTVILNEQQVVDGALVVNAVRLVLEGPSAQGEIVVAQSRCGVRQGAPLPAVSTPATAPPTAAPPPDVATALAPATPTPASTEAPAASAAGTAPLAAPAPEPVPGATIGVRTSTGAQAATTVSAVTGGAFGYSATVSLFGGTPGTRGPAPTVTLPAGGSSSPITDTAPSGEVTFGPATLFKSGALTVRTQGTTGAEGSVTSSASVTGVDDGPGPVLYDRIASTCTASAGRTTGSTTITGGVLETKYDADSGDPTVTEPIPANPAPNTRRTGTLDHIRDSYEVVFNEQLTGADGSLTVNAVHFRPLGPAAKGDLIIGQSRCGVTVVAASASSSSSPTSSSSSTAPSSFTAATSGADTQVLGEASGSGAGGAGSSPAAAASATGAGAGSSARRPAGTGTPLAFTGADTPVLPALALLVAALAAARGARSRRPRPTGLPANGD